MSAKILIIDDDVDIVEAEKLLLENCGYTVISAFDGQEGFRKISEEMPDLIILDVIMASPTEGFELARQLKEDTTLAGVPIIMVTSVRRDDASRNHLVEEAFPRVEAYIEKPIQPEEILAVVKSVLDRQTGSSKPELR